MPLPEPEWKEITYRIRKCQNVATKGFAMKSTFPEYVHAKNVLFRNNKKYIHRNKPADMYKSRKTIGTLGNVIAGVHFQNSRKLSTLKTILHAQCSSDQKYEF